MLTTSPPLTPIAMGARNSPPSPMPSADGIIPAPSPPWSSRSAARACCRPLCGPAVFKAVIRRSVVRLHVEARPLRHRARVQPTICRPCPAPRPEAAPSCPSAATAKRGHPDVGAEMENIVFGAGISACRSKGQAWLRLTRETAIALRAPRPRGAGPPARGHRPDSGSGRPGRPEGGPISSRLSSSSRHGMVPAPAAALRKASIPAAAAVLAPEDSPAQRRPPWPARAAQSRALPGRRRDLRHGSSVRARTPSVTPDGVNRTCSASSASRKRRGTPALPALAVSLSGCPSTAERDCLARSVAAASSSSARSHRPTRSRGQLPAIRTRPAAVGRDRSPACFGLAAARSALWLSGLSSGVGHPACRCMVLIAARRRPRLPRLSPWATVSKYAASVSELAGSAEHPCSRHYWTKRAQSPVSLCMKIGSDLILGASL